VFSTKQRRPLIQEPLREDLYRYVGGIVRGERGVLLEIGGMPDHVHIVAKLHPDEAVATMVRLVKSNSSKWANERPRRGGRFAWQTGYSAFSVSESQIERVLKYVRNQERHHKRKTFQEEYVELLKRNKIEYDPRYLWD
jgi:REP element-mobilizing transposase RayT